jgi:exopolysaccharide biosynthesis protein
MRYIRLVAASMLIILFSSSLFGSNPPKADQDSVAFVSAAWNWQNIGKKKMQYAYSKINMFGGIQSIAMVRYPSCKYKTAIADAQGKQAAATSILAIQHKAIAAINGSYFNMKELTPVTFIKVDGKILGKTIGNEDLRTNGVIAIKGRCSHKIRIFTCDTTMYVRKTEGWRSALASGPMLIENGQTIKYDKNPKDGFFCKRHPRTIFGYTSKGEVYMIVVDGRSKGNADGMTISELSKIVHYLGLETAINLDGGGSSAIWAEGPDILNHPCDNGKYDAAGERTVPNIIIVK